MSIETIVVAIIAGLVSGAINEWRARAARAVIREKLDVSNKHAAIANGLANATLRLLEPAVAQLPKTRAKKGKPDDGMSAAGPSEPTV